MSQPQYSVSVAGAVVDDGRLLAIRRRDNGAWEPPGGVLELNEHLHDGLRREVSEETGLIVQPEALTGVYQNMTRGIVAFVFRCHPIGGKLTTTDESKDVAWLTPEEITNRMSEAFAVRLLDALTTDSSYPSQPAIRCHDGRHLLSRPTSPQPASR